MGGIVHERYSPVVIGVNATETTSRTSVGGFLCKTAGTLTITGADGVVVIAAQPVSAGTWVDLHFFICKDGLLATTAGGASGVLGVC